MFTIEDGDTEALLHISHIKAHSSYQGCINQGQDLPQPGICSFLSQQFLHFSLAFSEAVENDPIQLCSSRPQPGCSAASPTSRTLILIFIRSHSETHIKQHFEAHSMSGWCMSKLLLSRQAAGQKPSSWCPYKYLFPSSLSITAVHLCSF